MDARLVRIKGYDLQDDDTIFVNFITWDGECLCTKQQHNRTFRGLPPGMVTKTKGSMKETITRIDEQILREFVADKMSGR